MEDYRLFQWIVVGFLLIKTHPSATGIQSVLHANDDLYYISTISCTLRVLYSHFSSEKYLLILGSLGDNLELFLSRSLQNEIKIPLLIQDVSFASTSLNADICSIKDELLVKATTILILVHDIETLEQLLKRGKECPYWNSAIKLIVLVIGHLSETYLRDMLKYCWELQVQNAVVVYVEEFQSKYNANVSLTMHNPFSGVYFNYRLCHCENYNCEENRDSFNFFSDKLGNLYGYVLKACGYELEPYLMVKSSNELGGLDWFFHESLSTRMNYTYSLDLEHNLVGFKLSNGTWTHAFGDIVSGKADLILNRVRLTAERLEAMEMSKGTIISSINFMVPKAGLVPKWKALVLPFQINIWVSIFFLLFVIELVWRRFIKVYGYHEYLVSRINPFLYVFSLFLRVSVPHKPLHFSFKFLFIVCAFLLLVLASLYEGSLIGFLTNDSHYPDINTLKELSESTLEIQSFRFHRNLLRNSSARHLRKMMSRYRMTDNMTDMLDSVGVRGTSACLYHNIILEYNANLKFTEASGGSSVHIITEPVVAYFGGYVLAKDSPYLSKIEQHATRILESGLDTHWREVLNYEVKLKKINLDISSSEPIVVLSIVHTKPIFILCVIGVQLGFICFVVEIVFSRISCKKP